MSKARTRSGGKLAGQWDTTPYREIDHSWPGPYWPSADVIVHTKYFILYTTSTWRGREKGTLERFAHLHAPSSCLAPLPGERLLPRAHRLQSC